MGREPKLMVGIGKKGVGKSVTTQKMMYAYVVGNPAKGVPPRRVLIIDVNDEYSDIPALSLDDVALFSVHSIVEIRRIRPFVIEDGYARRMTLDEIVLWLDYVLQNFKNGLLLVEDINKYISDTMPNDLVGAICTNRHIGVDIIIHYQSIGRITSKVWQNVNIIRLHKFTDTVKKHYQRKFEDKFEYLSIAEIIVNARYEKGDKYFFLYVDIDDEKIYGGFSSEEYDAAVNVFIQKNYNTIIAPLLKERNDKGIKVYNAATAIAEAKKRYASFKK